MASRITRSMRQETRQDDQQTRARWTWTLTSALAKLMVEQVYKGNRHNNSFNKKAWEEICDGFYTRTGLKWDKEQLKNWYSILRKQYVLVKSLLDESLFTLDETTGTISGSDRAWAEFIREHPDAEPLKTNGCPVYKDLCIIFSEPTTSTNGTNPNGHQPDKRQEESSSESEESDNVDRRETASPAEPSSGGVRKRVRKGIDDNIADAILEMAAASRMKTSAIQRRNARYSITKCIRELDDMQGLDDQAYFAALELFDVASARETFLSLQGDKRMVWLRSKCVAHSTF